VCSNPSIHNPRRSTGVETPPLARQPNYDFEKRKKEQERKAKQDAKREERRQRQADEAAREAEGEAPAADDQGGASTQG
jgi:hypothetical protein